MKNPVRDDENPEATQELLGMSEQMRHYTFLLPDPPEIPERIIKGGVFLNTGHPEDDRLPSRLGGVGERKDFYFSERGSNQIGFRIARTKK